jgi:hypothetical protein
MSLWPIPMSQKHLKKVKQAEAHKCKWKTKNPHNIQTETQIIHSQIPI